MSRVRISLTEWRDEGPSVPLTQRGRFEPRLAFQVGSMLPVVTGSISILTPSEVRRAAERRAAKIASRT